MDVTLNTEQWELLTSIIEFDKKDETYEDFPGGDNAHRAAIIQEALELLINRL